MAGTPVDYDPFATAEGVPVEHDPFSNKKESVFEAMKQGAKQAFSSEGISELGKNIPPNVAAKIAAPIRFATGAARIPANLMNMAGIEGPSKFVKAAEEGAKNLTESAGYTGMLPGIANLGGEVLLGGAALKGASKLAPVLEAIPGGAAISKGIAESPSAQAILGGMGLGAAGSSGSPYDVLKEAGLGGVFGLGGQSIASGIGHVAAPVLKNYKMLKDLGYTDTEILKNTSIGQLLGGKAQTMENAATIVPFGGVKPEVESKIKSFQELMGSKIAPIKERAKTAQNVLDVSQKQAQTLEQRALQDAERKMSGEMATRQSAELAAHKATGADIQTPVLNYVLEPLGKTLDPKLTGHAAIKEVKTAISNAYDESLAGISTLRLNKPIQEDLKSLTNTYNAGFLGKDSAELFKNDIDRLINDTAKGKWLTPENWQNQLSKLGKDAYQMRQKDPRYSQALYELKDKWMDLIEGQVGSDLFKAANTAFSRNKIPERAAAYSKSIKAEGLVEPNELINAARAELSTSRLAGGEDAIQKMAVEANKKYLADKAAIEAKQGAEKLSSQGASTAQTRALEDRFTGMGQSLAAQKAALQKQAETAVGKQEKAFESTVGSRTPEEYAAKRLGYQYGLAPMLGVPSGLAYMGIDPTLAAAASGATIAGTRGLYSSPIQDLLKQKAIAPRSPVTQAVGETLKENAPVAGLTLVQERQRSNNQQTKPTGALSVPK